MEKILELINTYGINTVIYCTLIFLILWFMKLTHNLVTTTDKRLDSIDKSLEKLNSSQVLIIELVKTNIIASRNNPDSTN